MDFPYTPNKECPPPPKKAKRISNYSYTSARKCLLPLLIEAAASHNESHYESHNDNNDSDYPPEYPDYTNPHNDNKTNYKLSDTLVKRFRELEYISIQAERSAIQKERQALQIEREALQADRAVLKIERETLEVLYGSLIDVSKQIQTKTETQSEIQPQIQNQGNEVNNMYNLPSWYNDPKFAYSP
jgi:hypothetical protein